MIKYPLYMVVEVVCQTYSSVSRQIFHDTFSFPTCSVKQFVQFVTEAMSLIAMWAGDAWFGA